MNILVSLIIAIIYIIPILYILLKNQKTNSIKVFLKNNIFEFIAIIILIIGIFIRVIYIDKNPVGLNQDEVSSAYEAFSILKYGIDRNNNSIPIHLVAWGSGQNAFYTYFIIPFLFIFKNTIISIRLPMALLSSFSLIFMYYLTKKEFGKKKCLIFLFIFSILPWHILKSRWGLESNVFPELIMYAIYFLYSGIKNEKILFKIISAIIFGISIYSYGTSYFFVPIMLILILVNCIIIKKIKINDIILILGITGIVALPMILFVIINFFDLDSITIFNITIPKLSVVRFKEITSLNEKGISFFENFKNGIKILINQRDVTPLNFAEKGGIFYTRYFSLPFIILGLVDSILKHKKNLVSLIFNYWFIVSLLLLGMVEPNINRINVIFIPIAYYLSNGIIIIYQYGRVIEKYIREKNIFNKSLNIGYTIISIIIIIYSINFSIFVKECFTGYKDNSQRALTYRLDDAIKRVNEINVNDKNVCITLCINQPYIYWLWYNEIDVHKFIEDSEILYKDTMFHYVKRIGNCYFGLPEILDENWIYIMENQDLEKYDISNYKKENFDKYNIIYK